jgi:NAD(P)-dependent dehydrogenase (short-subunit alcohol dehydrogenase family)
VSAADRPTFAPGLFQDRVVLVTGGTGGIGLACAEAFQRLGAEVIATGATDVEVERAEGERDRPRHSFRTPRRPRSRGDPGARERCSSPRCDRERRWDHPARR